MSLHMLKSLAICIFCLAEFFALHAEGGSGMPKGNGTDFNPYIIETWEHLYWLQENIDETGDGTHCIQRGSIDMSEAQPSISQYNNGKGWRPLKLIYDGQGFAILGLVINRPDEDNVGFASRSWQIRNLQILDAQVIGKDTVGIVAGQLTSWVGGSHSGVQTSGSVTGESFVGGVAGVLASQASLSKAWSSADVFGAANVGGVVGGISTLNNNPDLAASLHNSASVGTVTATTTGGVGGLLGVNYMGSVSHCFSTASVSAPTQEDGIHYSVGGLVGREIADAVVTASYWNTELSGVSVSAGGTGATSLQMQSESLYDSWDFNGLWEMGKETPLHVLYLSEPEGDGTEANPYLISDWRHLNWMVRAPKYIEGYYREGFHYRQTEDIAFPEFHSHAFGGLGWVPMDTLWGVYDGGGFFIENLTMAPSNSGVAGLFGHAHEAKIVAVSLTNVIISGHVTGGLVGRAYNTEISDCSVTGSVSGFKVGGLVGDYLVYNTASMERCTTDVAVIGQSRVGGLVGHLGGVLRHSSSRGTVSGEEFVGGLVGEHFYGDIDRCHSGADVTATIDEYTGIGGLIGYGQGPVKYSYAEGSVTGDYGVGGLIGQTFNGASVENSYATGAVVGDMNVGGLIGHCDSATVKNSYSVGEVTGTMNTGGLFGDFTRSTVTASYWDMDASGQTESAEGIALSTVGMQTEASFTDWNFNTLWEIEPNTNGGYPFFKGEMTTIIDNGFRTGKPNASIALVGNQINQFTISVPEQAYFEVYSLSGRMLYRRELQRGVTTFAPTPLASGSYILSVKSVSGDSLIRSFFWN